MPPLGQRYSPWHHLTFWRRLNQIPPNLLNANCIILPNVVKIKGLAVNFDNFSRPFTPLAASVCGGRYDLQDFTKMIAVLIPLKYYKCNSNILPINFLMFSNSRHLARVTRGLVTTLCGSIPAKLQARFSIYLKLTLRRNRIIWSSQKISSYIPMQMPLFSGASGNLGKMMTIIIMSYQPVFLVTLGLGQNLNGI